MRVLILGEAVTPGLVNKLLDELHCKYPITYIAETGDPKGMGFEASGWAFRNEVEAECFTPQWKELDPDKIIGVVDIQVNTWGKPYNRAAGSNRDTLLLKNAKPELVVTSSFSSGDTYLWERVLAKYPSLPRIDYSQATGCFHTISAIDPSRITQAPCAPTDLSHYEADALF